MSKPQEEQLWLMWRKGVARGRRRAWGYFLIGLFVGAAWSSVVMYTIGLLTKP